MDRKMAVTTSWVLVGGTLLLGGCMTPGLQLQEPPGFSATYQHFDRYWQPDDEIGSHRFVLPADFEIDVEHQPPLPDGLIVPQQEVVVPLICR